MVNRYLLACLAMAIANCGLGGCTSRPGTASVSGSVSYKNQSLPVGTITFIGEGKGSPVASGEIRNGSYKVDAPVGPVKIAITTPPPTRAPPPGVPAADARQPVQSVPIADRYGNIGTSGLSFTVIRGAQSHDINLD